MPLSPPLAPPPVTTERPWPLWRRVAFRFGALYLVIYTLPFPLDLFSGTGETVDAGYTRLWDPLVNWSARHLGVHEVLTTTVNGSGDRLGHYVQLLCIVVIACIGAVVWSILDRRRPDYRRAFDLLRVWVRYALASAMFAYGFAKIFPNQFSLPSPGMLVIPYGQSTPMALLWTFMGASPAYVVFGGLGEVFGGVLLLFRRTTTLGAAVLTGVLTNVVMLNYCYDVCVKQYSTHLLLMAIFLLLPSARRLLDFFVLNRAVPAADLGPPPAGSPARRRARLLVKAVFASVLVYTQASQSASSYAASRSNHPHSEDGIYDVEELRRNDLVAAPLLTDSRYIRQVAITPHGLRLVPIGRPQRIFPTAKEDSKGTWTLKEAVDDGASAAGTLSVTRLDRGRLVLEGTLDGERLWMRIVPSDPKSHRLLTRGFHWVNDAPYND